MARRVETEWQPKIIGWDDGTECVFYREGTAETLCKVWFLGTISDERQQYIEAAVKHVLDWQQQ